MIYPKACDIWALGCVIYYLHTQENLFKGKKQEEIRIEQYSK